MSDFKLYTELLAIVDQQKEIIDKQAELVSELTLKNLELENLIKNL